MLLCTGLDQSHTLRTQCVCRWRATPLRCWIDWCSEACLVKTENRKLHSVCQVRQNIQ